MTLSTVQVAAALDTTAESVGHADREFDRWIGSNCVEERYTASAEWYLQLAYGQLLTLAEALQLPLLRAEIQHQFEVAQQDGMVKIHLDADSWEHNDCAAAARRYIVMIRTVFGTEARHTVTKELESILQAATYSVTDSRVFRAAPKNEGEVHVRLESVLRCVFPDLIHKPRLAKPIKSFEPDTGIPSLRTLIEYKFLGKASEVSRIADELLADTRGYASPEWSSIIYVVYETKRFKAASEWRQLLRACGVDSNTSVVVMSGEPPGPVSKGRGHVSS